MVDTRQVTAVTCQPYTAVDTCQVPHITCKRQPAHGLGGGSRGWIYCYVTHIVSKSSEALLLNCRIIIIVLIKCEHQKQKHTYFSLKEYSTVVLAQHIRIYFNSQRSARFAVCVQSNCRLL